MAITAAVLTSAADSVDATSKATASVTTNATRLTLAWIINTKATTPELPTITDGSRTWVQVATVLYASIASPLRRLTCFRCMTGATGALTFDFGGATQTGFVYSVEEYAGVNLGGTNGSAAIVQVVTDRNDSANAFTVTLAAFGSAGNATVGAVGTLSGGITQGSGFTELMDLTHGAPASRLQTQWRADNDTTVDWSWAAAVGCGGIALELAEAGSTLLAATPAILTWVVPTALVVVGALSVAAPPAIASWTVPVATVTAGALSLNASPATSTWTVAPATVTGDLTLAATPAITTWTVPTASPLIGPLMLAANPATALWTVPTAVVASTGLITLVSTPAVMTWVVPTALVHSLAPSVTVSYALRGSVQRTVFARGSWILTIPLRGRVG